MTTYNSPLSLSNDPADWTDAALLAGSSLVWPISADTKLKRDPSRVFSGIYLPYEGGAVFRRRMATATTFTHRDAIMPSLNVKSSTKAIARAVRYLDQLKDQDERITTTVELPRAIATKLRAGMMVRFKATHFPGYTSFRYCRVLSCSPKPVAAGARYRLALELEKAGTGTLSYAFTATTTDRGQSTAEGYSSNTLDTSGWITGDSFTVAITYTRPSNASYGEDMGFVTSNADNTIFAGHFANTPFAIATPASLPTGYSSPAIAGSASTSFSGTYTVSSTDRTLLTAAGDIFYWAVIDTRSPNPNAGGAVATCTITPI